MHPPVLVARARAVWESRAGGAAAFSPVARVAVGPQSRLCPPGWAGVVSIDGLVIATAPDPAQAAALQRGLAALPAAALADGDLLRGRLPIADLRGPAVLAYLDAAEFRTAPGGPPAGPRDPRDDGLRRFLSGCAAADVQESGLAEITSPAFTVRGHDQAIIAAAGYREWAGGVAHLSVLTSAPARGRGLARAAASAAVAHALARGLLPQWRAVPAPSRRVAASLGFRELGYQASILLRT
jgi:RimJ/RimL family protein N-acetyltransferase